MFVVGPHNKTYYIRSFSDPLASVRIKLNIIFVPLLRCCFKVSKHIKINPSNSQRSVFI
jgi:hypothetical protein